MARFFLGGRICGLPLIMGRSTCCAGVLILMLLPVALTANETNFPDWQAEPLYGTLNVHDYPDRWIAMVPLRAGGTMRMPRAAGADCAGYVEGEQPDLDLNIRTSENQTVTITARSASPVVLVLYTAEEKWVCAAYGGTRDTTLTVSEAVPGNYNLWLGTSSEETDYPAVDVLIRAEELMKPAAWGR